MKTYFSLLLMIASYMAGLAQQHNTLSFDDFESEVLAYEPVMHDGITSSNLEYASMIIRQTKSAVKGDGGDFNRADYFNILSAFLTLKESEQNIMLAFQKFLKSEGSCEYIIAFEEQFNKSSKYALLKDRYQLELQKCKSQERPSVEFDIQAYARKLNLDVDLIKTIQKIDASDRRYRSGQGNGWQEKQTLLDAKNQKLIDDLYRRYNTYLGKSLVGPKFETNMWAVIQHAPVNMMERYLPVLQKAVHEDELALAPFKMLLDRFYGLKHGYQIFGSQSGFGFELADEETRQEVVSKYGIEE